jgi:hypothetical protein
MRFVFKGLILCTCTIYMTWLTANLPEHLWLFSWYKYEIYFSEISQTRCGATSARRIWKLFTRGLNRRLERLNLLPKLKLTVVVFTPQQNALQKRTVHEKIISNECIFIGACAKKCSSFVSICPCVRAEQIGSHLTDFN